MTTSTTCVRIRGGGGDIFVLTIVETRPDHTGHILTWCGSHNSEQPGQAQLAPSHLLTDNLPPS